MLKPKLALPPAAAQPSLDQRIHAQAQQVFERIFYTAAIGFWLVAVLTATLVALVAPAQRSTALAWLLVDTAVLAANLVSWQWAEKKHLTLPQKDIAYGLMAVPHALIWVAAAVLFFDPQQILITIFLVCMMSGAGSGAVSALAALPHIFFILMVPAFLAQSAVYALRGGDAFHVLLAVAMLVLLGANLIFLKGTNRVLKQSIRLAFENLDLVAQLREQTAAAQDANTAKTKFLAAASHDLRQPVHALMLFLEVLGNTKLNDHQQTIMGHVRTASQASSELLNTLLDFSRIEAGVMQPKPQAVALAPLLRELEDEFGPQADSKQLVYRSRDTEAVAYCDRSLVALVLRNFVSNAVRYTNSGGVLIGVRSQGDLLRIQVCDTGIGIAPEHHDEIFKEFHQLGNDERDRQKGLGLGLAIAKGLAHSMDARITLSSATGRGSVFSLWLPKSKLPAESLFVPAAAPAALPNAGVNADHNANSKIFEQTVLKTSRLDGLNVLVVDDDAAVRLSMSTLLQSWGCAVRTAEGLQDAQGIAAQNAPQMLVTDYRLRNGHTGGDVITALRGQCGGDLPAIIITGDTDPARLRETSAYQATLLHKPVSAVALRDAMAALVLA